MDETGKVEYCAFDPTIYDEPVPVGQWASMIGAHGARVAVMPLGMAPFHLVGDYVPEDPLYDMPGMPTNETTDAHARQDLKKLQQALSAGDQQPRIVYSSDMRSAAEKHVGQSLPKQGSGWINIALYKEREQAERAPRPRRASAPIKLGVSAPC
jgi:hypothetical protein